jgi:glycosyltransferase involved in cell wall biosynthesis
MRVKRALRDCDIIFADSQSTKNDITSFFHVGDYRIVVNYPGVELAHSSARDLIETKEKFALNSPFILTVGKLEPRKNIERLIEAFNLLDEKKTQLLIVGAHGWGTQPESSNPRIRMLGFVNDRELTALYKLARAFVYPSIYEGFGYPVAEAMSLGVPTATSNSSSMKEIAGDSALLFNPENVKDIARCLQSLLHDEDVRSRLATHGTHQATHYTWKRYADILLDKLGENKG